MRIDAVTDRPPVPTVRFPLLIPLVAVAAVTLAATWSGLDFALSAACYDAGTRTWTHAGDPLWVFIDDHAEKLSVPIVLAAVGMAVAGRHLPSKKHWLRPGLFLLAVAAIAPGFMVNGVLKGAWGRPRPLHLEEFGNVFDAVNYQPFYEFGDQPSEHKSFPSGHATMAFFTIAPAFVFGATRRKQAYAWLACGLAIGTVVGTARVVQGNHFFTDVAWGGMLVYATCCAFRPIFLRVEGDAASPVWRERSRPVSEPPVEQAETRVAA
ncbi:MAG: phosphatase PAP2 family protein [Planctomycetota bacterium]